MPVRSLMSTDCWRPATVVSVFLLALAGPANAARPKTVEAPTPASAPPAAPAPVSQPTIPVEEVATQATQVSNLIRGFATNLAPSAEIEEIQKFLPQMSAATALDLRSATNILREHPALDTLQAQDEIWQQRHSQLTAWLNTLTNRATKLQLALTELKKLQETWTRTRVAEEAAKAPGPILEQIDTALAAIAAAQQPHQTQRDEILNLQGKVAEQLAACNTMLSQIAALQQKAVGGIFTPENPPIWSGELRARATTAFSERFPEVVASYRRDILDYIHDPSRHLPRHVVIFIVLSLVLLAARRQVGKWQESEDRTLHDTAVFDHVFAAALLLTLMIASAPTSPVPVTVKRLFQIAALVPIILLTRRAVVPIVLPVIYAVAILFAVDTVRRAIAGEPPMGQGILVLEAIGGIAVLAWLLVYGPRRAARSLGQTSHVLRSVGFFILLFCF